MEIRCNHLFPERGEGLRRAEKPITAVRGSAPHDHAHPILKAKNIERKTNQ